MQYTRTLEASMGGGRRYQALYLYQCCIIQVVMSQFCILCNNERSKMCSAYIMY